MLPAKTKGNDARQTTQYKVLCINNNPLLVNLGRFNRICFHLFKLSYFFNFSKDALLCLNKMPLSINFFNKKQRNRIRYYNTTSYFFVSFSTHCRYGPCPFSIDIATMHGHSYCKERNLSSRPQNDQSLSYRSRRSPPPFAPPPPTSTEIEAQGKTFAHAAKRAVTRASETLCAQDISGCYIYT